MTGIIVKGVGGLYEVLLPDGQRLSCTARGAFRHQGMTPTVGDRVEVRDGAVDAILPRDNLLVRPPVANIQLCLTIFSLRQPQADYLLLDRMLLCAAQQGIAAKVVFTKTDLAPEELVQKACAAYAAFGAVGVCAETGQGVAELREALSGLRCAVAGPSGAGKSSLIAAMYGITLATGELSQKLMRGKHTTREVTLLSTPDGGLLADTPGFSLLEPVLMDPGEMAAHWPEFSGCGRCGFDDCRHDTEPNCAVRAAVGEGVPAGRHRRYIELLHEMEGRWKQRYR